MKQRILASVLVFLLIFSLIPLIGAKGVGEVEAEPAAFGGTLNNTTDLLFDFSNNEAAQTRYKGSAYGGYNFDKETNGYWATGYNTNKTNYSISNANGTLRVKVTDGADASGTYGPWIKVTNTYGILPSFSEASHPYYPLNFNPENVKFVTIKFKLSGCSVPGGQVPKVVFEYYFTKGGTYSYANDMAASFTPQDGYYQTVTIPVSSKLKGADVLKGFGFRFRNVRGTNGTIYIDHIYIGASGNMELPSHGDRTVLSQSVNPILTGVNESQIYLKDKSDSAQMAGYMATVAPSAKVTFKASYPGYYTKGSTVASRKTAAPNLPFKGATTTAQAAAYETATGETVYLAINADFFNMETFHTRGQLAMEGNVIQTYGTRATPFFAVLKDGSYAIRPFGAPMGDVEEAVAGYHWLVRNGSLVFNEDVRHPRTAIGLKKDGTVVIFAVDGRQEPYSAGMTLEELAELMLAAGCVDAINLDGGGSTTFATRYNNGASDLIIRNKPCDSAGQRTVTSTLLLVAQSCKHIYNKGYTIHADGTHSVSCASCGNKITVTHTYINGACACGNKQAPSSGLYFGFGNTAADNDRYADPAYKYYNFDQTDNGKWNRGTWYTGYTETTQDYTIDHSAGTITVKVSDKYSGSETAGNLTYGPWLKITNADGVGPSKTVSTYRPLNYAPTNVDCVELRFKLTGCQVPNGKTPKVYFEYYYTKGGTYAGATDMYNTYSFTDGAYVTVMIPASGTLKSADILCGFGLRFQNIKSTSGGKLILDYIHIKEAPLYTVTFKGATGEILAQQAVRKGETAVYTGPTPTKAYDGDNHYTFSGWDLPLTDVRGDTVFTAQFTPTAHGWDEGAITLQPSCTEAGNRTYTCSACGAMKTEPLSPTGHSYRYAELNITHHSVTCHNCNLSEEAPHSYVYGSCICGAVEIKEPIEDVTLKLNHSLNLASDISVNLVVSKTLLVGFDMDTVYVESVIDTYEGNEKTGTQTIRIRPVESEYYYYFTLDGLTAVQMNDKIVSVLYGTKDGQPYYSPVDTYSIATYAYAQLNKTGIAESLKILCADLLRYGSKAQIFKAYRTDSLADSAMTEAQRAYLSDIETVTFGNTNRVLNDLENAPITWAGKALNLESKVALKFIFNSASYNGDLSELTLRISYEDAYGNPKTEVVTAPEPYGQGTGAYVFTVDSLPAAELRAVVSVQIYAGHTPVSCTLRYSADTYGNNKTGTLLHLCKALFAYSDSAKAYFAP